MKISEFLSKVAEAIEHEGDIALGTELESIPSWDSLGILNVLDMLEQCGVSLDLEKLQSAKTIDDVVALAGSAVHG